MHKIRFTKNTRLVFEDPDGRIVEEKKYASGVSEEFEDHVARTIIERGAGVPGLEYGAPIPN